MEKQDIVTAGPSDASAVLALVREAYSPYISRIGRPPAPLEADYVALIATGRVRVARRGGRIVGLLITTVHSDHVLVENVAVADSERGTGLGAALLDIADHEARASGVADVRLYTNERMTENLAYYRRRGFRETGRRTEDGFSRVYFARRVEG